MSSNTDGLVGCGIVLMILGFCILVVLGLFILVAALPAVGVIR